MRKKREIIRVNKEKYTILRNFGYRNNGYLYVVSHGETLYMLKEVHGEIEKIVKDYEFLLKQGIPMPKLIDVDFEKGLLVAEYLDGESAYSLLQKEELLDTYLDQLRKMSVQVEQHNVCLDYFPTHYVCLDKVLYYTHYTCEKYSDANRFDTCVKKYWIGKEDLWNTFSLR